MKFSKLAVAVLSASLVWTAPADAGKNNDTLVFADREDFVSFDQYYGTDRIGIIIGYHIFDRLIYRDPQTNELKPMLATSWKWLDDRTLELKLRSGVTFHDGETFEAEDVVYTLKHAINPASKIKAMHNVQWIEDVQQVDNMTVRIKTKHPYPAALQFLAGPLPIYGKTYYEKVGPDGMNKKPIGTGPYMVEKIEPGSSVRFVRNDKYWQGGPRGAAKIKNVVLRTIPDSNTQVAELMTGGVDWIWKVPVDQAKSLDRVPTVSVVRADTMRVGYLSMDAAGRAGNHPFTNKAVRQALAYSINREAIRKGLMSDGGRVLDALCYPTQFGCTQDVRRYEYDPAKAKKLLAEAGYPNGFEVVMDAYQDRELAEAMIGNLRQVGIAANLNFGQYAPLTEKIRNGKSVLNFRTHGSYSINDVSAILPHIFGFTTDDIHRDAKVKEYLVAGESTLNEAVRKDNYTKALSRIEDEALVLPLWTYPIAYAFSKDLDFKPAADEIPRFDAAQWKK